MKIFVTGGAGFIGSHTCIELINNAHDVLVFDNLSTGSKLAVERIKQITKKNVGFLLGDIRDAGDLSRAMLQFQPDVVVHFAGLKSINESLEDPLRYYDVNVHGTLELLKAIDKSGCRTIVFSSSATVYGNAVYLPYDESHPLNPTNPYGRSKLVVEHLLEDWAHSSKKNRAVCLRYFNPIGAHDSGLIGECVNQSPSNLMPVILQVADGSRTHISVFGDDYPTRDGTGERDYIHVMDVALGHLKSIEKANSFNPFEVLNLGTGRGTTVIELIKAFEQVSGKKITMEFRQRRKGDVPQSWADPTRAFSLLGTKFQRTVARMCQDAWRWQRNNSIT